MVGGEKKTHIPEKYDLFRTSTVHLTLADILMNIHPGTIVFVETIECAFCQEITLRQFN